MLTCSGCRVVRFCSPDHQKMASKKAALGGSLTKGRHKDICGVLSKWCEAVKDVVAPDSCTLDLVAFLQRENARCPKDAEGAPEAVAPSVRLIHSYAFNKPPSSRQRVSGVDPNKSQHETYLLDFLRGTSTTSPAAAAQEIRQSLLFPGFFSPH